MATNEIGFIYYEDAEVSRKNAIYKVKLIDEERTMYLKKELVDSLALNADQDENLIAILIAHIKFVRIDRQKDIEDFEPCLKNEVLLKGLDALLKEIPIEELIERMRSLKWHKIVEIITDEQPIERYRDL